MTMPSTKEKIQAIVFSPDLTLGCGNNNNNNNNNGSYCSNYRNYSNSLLEQPALERLVSYEDMLELNFKLNDMMKNNNETSAVPSPLDQYNSHKVQEHGSTIVVSLDDDAYSTSTASTSSTIPTSRRYKARRSSSHKKRSSKIPVIPEPLDDDAVDEDDASPPPSDGNTKKNNRRQQQQQQQSKQQPKQGKKSSKVIDKEDVLRVRKWGKRVQFRFPSFSSGVSSTSRNSSTTTTAAAPSQFLPRPMLDREPSSE